MSNLLQVVRLNDKEMKKGVLPLMMEVPVDPTLTPILVSSSTSLLWVEEAHPGNVVKAAVRQITSPGEVFKEVLLKVEERSLRDEWGSTNPYSEEGVKEALKYLAFYELGDVELLVPFQRAADHKGGLYHRPEWLKTEAFNVPLRPTSWVPDDCVVAVPLDRDFVGTIAHLNPRTVVVVVHNASRGIAMAKDPGKVIEVVPVQAEDVVAV